MATSSLRFLSSSSTTITRARFFASFMTSSCRQTQRESPAFPGFAFEGPLARARRGRPSATAHVSTDQPLHLAEEFHVTDRLFEIAVEALGEQPLAIALHRERGE